MLVEVALFAAPRSQRGKAIAGLRGDSGRIRTAGQTGVEGERGVGQAVAVVLQDGAHEAEGEVVPALGLGEIDRKTADVAKAGAFGALRGAEGGLARDVEQGEDGGSCR